MEGRAIAIYAVIFVVWMLIIQLSINRVENQLKITNKLLEQVHISVKEIPAEAIEDYFISQTFSCNQNETTNR